MGVANNDEELEKLKVLAHEWITAWERYDARMGQQSFIENTSIKEEAESRIQQAEARKLGRAPKKTLDQVVPVSQVSLDDIVEVERIVEGVHEVGGRVYDELGFDEILASKKQAKLLKDLVLARLVYPESKHKLQSRLDTSFDKEYDLDKVYRLMDSVYAHIPSIKSLTFKRTSALFPDKKTDVVLFDVTTLYFESTITDDLRQFGYSKDSRFNTIQVVLALATNGDGLPIGYELFKGNKAEVQTLCESIASWQQIFDIGSVCFVGDRAMFSETNLKLLEEKKYTYVVAAKLRTLSEDLQDQILDEKNYTATVLKNDIVFTGEFTHKGRRLIATYKSKRAQRDTKQRETLLEKIKKKLDANSSGKQLVTNAGIKKYTKTSEGTKIALDEAKIQADALWDGMHGIITNLTDQDPAAILSRYARLWVIEDAFRTNKHNLKIRPIYHWKQERIKAHIAICYMSFAVLRQLEYRVSLTQKLYQIPLLNILFLWYYDDIKKGGYSDG